MEYYKSYEEAKQQEVVDYLGSYANQYDVDAIAEEALVLVNKGGEQLWVRWTEVPEMQDIVIRNYAPPAPSEVQGERK